MHTLSQKNSTNHAYSHLQNNTNHAYTLTK